MAEGQGSSDPTRRRRIARKLIRRFYRDPVYPADGIVPVRDICAACGGTGEQLLPPLESGILDYLARNGPAERRDICQAYRGVSSASVTGRALNSLFSRGLLVEIVQPDRKRHVQISPTGLDLRAAGKAGAPVDQTLAQGMVARVTPLRCFTLDFSDLRRLGTILNAIRHGYILGADDQRLLALALDNYKKIIQRIDAGL